ncbi:rhomboid family intramembrane serine protease [Mucilaginibacter robiniae]|uniref:Rhomboid family intramembrane serine protease n=1 Tax=Mucilaginibacter robiniae TaxID=2728022 RepID=A0A7L5DWA4_9SPHI|nr:rhomboid family intramembrane serine protease [Mucilaginibacter robiniae]QJD95360.1 rhomboid family intramembrane serine protease [Mucilaginibacter robiniae]
MSPYTQSPFSNITPVVKNLLIINIIFFVATYALGRLNIDLVALLSAFYPSSPNFKIWQIITYLFMHANLGHIFSNMLGLFFIGPILEQTFGSKRFFNYYFITGIGALLFNFIVQAIHVHQITGAFFPDIYNYTPRSESDLRALIEIYRDPILGASGAIFGLMAAIFALYPDLEFLLFPFPIPVKVKYMVPLYVLYELYSGVNPKGGDMVAHFAHVGGAVVGYILIKIWHTRTPNNFY